MMKTVLIFIGLKLVELIGLIAAPWLAYLVAYYSLLLINVRPLGLGAVASILDIIKLMFLGFTIIGCIILIGVGLSACVKANWRKAKGLNKRWSK